MEATRCLREDHRVIRCVLDGFERALGDSERAQKVSREEYQPFLDFFRDFAEVYHYRREEEQLFALLRSKQVIVPGTPIALVLEEHELGRALTPAMAEALERGGDDPEGAATFLAHGRRYLEFLRKHADKEEHCVYGMAERVIRGRDLEALLAVYGEAERDPACQALRDRGRAFAAEVVARYGLSALPAAPAALPQGEVAAVPGAEDAGRQEAWLWRDYASRLAPDPGSDLAIRVERALQSPAVAMQRAMLERIGRRIEPAPLLWRVLPSGHLRLFFPVTGASDAIEKGTVVALVLLYDLAEERPLYAHPVHAGPGANPLLQHLSGPMAHPKAQEGGNGERATLRLLEHKRALWQRFEHEREELGPEEAGRLWRERYGWSLVRLYFCERCAACRFGSPFFEGSDGEPFRSTGSAVPEEARELRPGESSQIAAAVRASEPWRIEVAYAQRGGFTVRDEPSRVEALGADWRVVLFPTDAEWIEGGTLVGAIAYFHVPSGETRYASCLSAGPEAETLFLRGDTALGLPLTDAAARGAYAAWRAQAWSSFWLDELELGLHAASRRWLHGYWDALGRLFGAGSASVREGRSAD